jgi:hypothetical protein
VGTKAELGSQVAGGKFPFLLGMESQSSSPLLGAVSLIHVFKVIYFLSTLSYYTLRYHGHRWISCLLRGTKFERRINQIISG